ncbi:uncharacterized protein LOC128260572 [Drosophila gunungcola]|nr:uncharacterized protein LOC128260572 [Drosophila gunungcola]
MIFLRITCARSMSFDLPMYGFDTYLDNTSDDMLPDEAKCDPKSSVPVTMEPPPSMRPSHQFSSSTSDGYCGNMEMINTNMKATHIAQKAADVARAANNAQAEAAQNASRKVKMKLAKKAKAASSAADAVLEGKQNIVDHYESEMQDAEEVVKRVANSLESSEADAGCACAAVKAAEAQAASFGVLVNSTRGTLADIEQLIEQAHKDLDEKVQMLAAAKARGERLARQVAQAKVEYELVRESACRAANDATEAKQKAAASNCVPPPTTPPPRAAGCGGAFGSDRASYNVLLDLYRQRRRDQQRKRREKLPRRGIRGQGKIMYKGCDEHSTF